MSDQKKPIPELNKIFYDTYWSHKRQEGYQERVAKALEAILEHISGQPMSTHQKTSDFVKTQTNGLPGQSVRSGDEIPF